MCPREHVDQHTQDVLGVHAGEAVDGVGNFFGVRVVSFVVYLLGPSTGFIMRVTVVALGDISRLWEVYHSR